MNRVPYANAKSCRGASISPTGSLRIIRGCRKLAQRLEEVGRLADEQTILGQSLHRAHGGAFSLGRTNDGTDREFAVQEWRRFRHDEVGLEVLAAERRGVEIREYETGIRRVGQRRGIAGLVLPGLEIGRLGGADAQ